MKKLLLNAVAICALAGPALAAGPQIDPAKLSEHIKVLSSDAFEGRGPATAGETKTVAYIFQQFKAAGLQPGGDLKDGKRAWTQDVPLAAFDINGPGRRSASPPAARREPWTQGERDRHPRAARPAPTSIDIKDAPIVFVGYGVKAPGAQLGRLQGRRPEGQDRGRAGQRSRLRDRQGRLRRQGHDLLRPLDLQVRGGRAPGRARLPDRPRDRARPPTAGTRSRTPTPTRCSTSSARTRPRRHAPMEAWIQRDAAVRPVQDGRAWTSTR